MLDREKPQPTNTTVDRLLENDGTLYDEKPSNISLRIKNKLNQIYRSGRDISSIVSIPDYHNIVTDGGTKDILFITLPTTSMVFVNWETTTLLENDKGTMHGVKTKEIQSHLKTRIQDLERQGNIVRHIIPITDSHSSAMFGGLDGLKDLIICYHKR